jgi:hypothetical protein
MPPRNNVTQPRAPLVSGKMHSTKSLAIGSFKSRFLSPKDSRVVCPTCHGFRVIVCPTCRGSRGVPSPFGGMPGPCPTCSGQGYVKIGKDGASACTFRFPLSPGAPFGSCPTCMGKGWIQEEPFTSLGPGARTLDGDLQMRLRHNLVRPTAQAMSSPVSLPRKRLDQRRMKLRAGLLILGLIMLSLLFLYLLLS